MVCTEQALIYICLLTITCLHSKADVITNVMYVMGPRGSPKPCIWHSSYFHSTQWNQCIALKHSLSLSTVVLNSRDW